MGVQAAMEKLGGSTGVLEAINRAVSLRQPIYVFPVANLESGACEGPSPGDQAMQGGGVRGGWQPAPSSGAGGAVLRDCMMLRPGATVFEVGNFGSLLPSDPPSLLPSFPPRCARSVPERR